MNLTLQEYQQASDVEIQELINYIERTRPDLRFDSFLTESPYQLPRFAFSRLKNMYFIYIPGGKFRMGLSEAEEWAAREICDPPPMNMSEMRPVTELDVAGFLVAETPFLEKHAWCMQAYVKLEPSMHVEDIERVPYCNYNCPFEIAQALASELNADLPREDQWEYFCRGNTNTLFVFGNSFPDRFTLTSWFKDWFYDLSDMKRNNFGIGGLFMTEWCANLFRYDYSSDKVVPLTRLLRGGGADFYAWRSDKHWDPLDSEDWVWFASAKRMPSTYLVDGTAGFRLIINLNIEK